MVSAGAPTPRASRRASTDAWRSSIEPAADAELQEMERHRIILGMRRPEGQREAPFSPAASGEPNQSMSARSRRHWLSRERSAAGFNGFVNTRTSASPASTRTQAEESAVMSMAGNAP